MKTGIIGLPQVGKTSLFKILTKVDTSNRTYSNPREAHLGIAKVPDDRLDRLAAQYNPKKLTHVSVEYADVAAIGKNLPFEFTRQVLGRIIDMPRLTGDAEHGVTERDGRLHARDTAPCVVRGVA